MPSDSSDRGANKDDDADTSNIADCTAAGMHITPAKAKSRSIKLFVVLWF